MGEATKTVLVISYLAPPRLNAEAILVWKTVRELSKTFRIRLMTSNEGQGLDQGMDLPSSVSVIRGKTLKPKGGLLRRLVDKAIGLAVDEEYLWMRANRRLAAEGDIDVIYSRSQPGSSHMLAYHVKRLTDKPWIAQFSDPWANNPYHRHHSNRRKAFNRKWERAVVSTADKLIFPTVEIQAMYEASYPELPIREKSIVLPHHFLAELYPKSDVTGIDTREDRIVFSYMGDFYGDRSPEPFLKALQYVLNKFPQWTERIQVNFYGNVESKFTEVVNTCPVPMARGRVPYLDSLKMMKQSDVLLLIDAPSESGTNPFMASKLIDYLGTGRRILGITDERGTASEILRACGHAVVRPQNIDGIATVIEQYMESCLNARQTEVPVPDEYETSHVVGRLARLMTELTSD